VDAGIKTGYALLDLSGNLICSGVEKEANDERIVKIISSVGIPSIVASDTCPPSSFVAKVAARFQTRLFHPRKSLTQEEKRVIGRDIDDVKNVSPFFKTFAPRSNERANDPHIRDAYAAAVKAYRRYADRLRQIDRMEGVDREELKHLVIKGKPIGKILKTKQ